MFSFPYLVRRIQERYTYNTIMTNENEWGRAQWWRLSWRFFLSLQMDAKTEGNIPFLASILSSQRHCLTVGSHLGPWGWLNKKNSERQNYVPNCSFKLLNPQILFKIIFCVKQTNWTKTKYQSEFSIFPVDKKHFLRHLLRTVKAVSIYMSLYCIL